MTRYSDFTRAKAGDWIAETFDRPTVAGGVGVFELRGTSTGYTAFGDHFAEGEVVFYAAFDDACNRECGFATFSKAGPVPTLTPVESNATLANGQFVDGDVKPIAFPNGGTITGTFNSEAFNTIWNHIWDKGNPHDVEAYQVAQDNEQLGDTVQQALDTLLKIIKAIEISEELELEVLMGMIKQLQKDLERLEDALEQEKYWRIEGDEHLQEQIDNLEPYDDTQIKQDLSDLDDKIEKEIGDRGDADKLLQDQIDALDSGKADLSALNDEIKAREDGDKALSDRIDNLKVDDLVDTDADSPNADEFLIYDGTKWVAEEFHIDTELSFKGGLSVPSDPAPAAENGDLYINNEEGVAGASWTGIAGRYINPANAVGWSATNNRWYMLGDIATSAVTEIREGTAIKVDATGDPSRPIVSLDKALTNSWYTHTVETKTGLGIKVTPVDAGEGFTSYIIAADKDNLGKDFAPLDAAYMYTDQANACTPDFTIDCQKTTITSQAVSSATIEGEYFSARLDDSFFNMQNTFAFTNRAGNALFIDGTGEGITAPKIKKVNGTSDQLLCADGSVATKTEVGGTYQLPVGKSSNNSLRWGVNGWEASELLSINDGSSQVWVAGDLSVNLSLSAFKIVKSGGKANELLCADGSVVDKASVGTDTDLSNYYTKAQADAAFDKYTSWRWQTSDSKGNVSATTNVASNGLINFEAGPNMTILKSSNNTIVFDALPFGDATNYYTKTEADNKFQVKGSYATQAWVTQNHYTKTETKKNVVMTEAQYNALGTKDAETVYFLT